MPKKAEIDKVLTRNVENIIEAKHLKESLGSDKLRIKFGIDPTGTKIHIGRAVALWKLREFQELGHKIVLIIGDFTAQIGDPSDKLKKRPFLSNEDVKNNLKGYLEQIGKIIDLDKAEIRYNSEWLSKLNFQEISQLAEVFTVQQMIARRNFKERWDKEEEISLREFLYPLMQGYDSVAVKSDLELGGSDQLFNLMAGRRMQEYYHQKPQDIMTTKMLLGLDGRKMSTSWGNVINITDEPEEQFGKIMSMKDDMIREYFEIATDLEISEIERIEKEYDNPKFRKEQLGMAVVARYHGREAAEKAKDDFQKLFSKKEVPEDIPELTVSSDMNPVDLIVLSGVVKSKSEARRLVEQGGFEIGGASKKDPREIIAIKSGMVVKVGKRHFFKIK